MDNRIRELRTAGGLRQEDLAERVGVSRQTIISIENGRYNPSLELARRLSKALGSSEILGGLFWRSRRPAPG